MSVIATLSRPIPWTFARLFRSRPVARLTGVARAPLAPPPPAPGDDDAEVQLMIALICAAQI
jgi:hypothetical protein